MISWDEWRANYDRWTIHEHQRFYSDVVWRTWPDQRHFNLEAVLDFFSGIHEGQRVFEVGGWRGELAAEVLESGIRINRWLNVEICREAADAPVTTDPAYKAVVPNDWVWNTTLAYGSDVVVLSHVIEHWRWVELQRFLGRIIDARYLFIQSPLALEPTDWTGYEGTHILEVGWLKIEHELHQHGWLRTKSYDDPEDENNSYRAYERTP